MNYLLVYGERKAHTATQHEAIMAGAKVGSGTYYAFEDTLMESHPFQIEGTSHNETLGKAQQYAEAFIEKARRENPKLRRWNDPDHVFSTILEDDWYLNVIHNSEMPNSVEEISVGKSVIAANFKAYIEIRWDSSQGSILLPSI